MPEPDDITLLKQYAGGDESAFTTLFERHVRLVYSAALRQAGNPSHAEEITQAVFVLLARKAKSLSPKIVLSGWLYQAARFTAAGLVRRELRRERREQEVYMQTLTGPETSLWEEISPLLDEAMGRLGERDRNAIVLRFFENRTPEEVAATLKLNEATARKRVSRALEKLRNFFAKRGVVLTTAILAASISSNSVHAAPAAVVANSAAAVAIAKGAAASASTSTLVEGALKLMAWTKAKTAIVIAAGVLLAAGTAHVAAKKSANEAWQEKYNPNLLTVLPSEVKIRPSLSSTVQSHTDVWGVHNDRAMVGLGLSVPELSEVAYEAPPFKLIENTPIPDGRYDFYANLATWDGNLKAMQEEIRKQFGLTARREKIETNVLVLTVKSRHAPGLRRATHGISYDAGPSSYSAHDESIEGLINYLNSNLGVIIIDQTGLTGNLDVDFKWDGTSEDLKRAVLDELGLDLKPSVQAVEFVVVEKAK